MSAPPESESHRAGSPSGPQSHGSDELRIPSDAELAEMSTDDLVRLGNRMDDIEVVADRPGSSGDRASSFSRPNETDCVH